MKIPTSCAAMIIMAALVIGCKKSDNVKPSIDGDAGLMAAGTAEPTYAVQTLYGSPYVSGSTDGVGTAARFNYPQGLQIMEDGTLYVADCYNNAIRKISPAGVVSTLSLKASPGGEYLTKPVYVGVSFKTGDIHVIQDGEFYGDPFDESWLFKSNGDFVASSYYTYTIQQCLARDSYTDIFYFSSSNRIQQHTLDQYGEINGPTVPINKNNLEEPERTGPRGFGYSAVAVGYNKVIYFAAGGHIYKQTPGGVTERIFADLNLSNVTCIVLNKDSRTMYVVDNGYIKRIDSGKLKVLAGPRGTNDGRDGANLTADVYAGSLALAKGENMLFFTDPHANTIRKITLN